MRGEPVLASSSARTWSMADIHAAIADGVAAVAHAVAAPRPVPQQAARPRRALATHIVTHGDSIATTGAATDHHDAVGAAPAPPQSASSAAHGVVYHGTRVACFYCHPDPAQLSVLGAKAKGVCKDLAALARHHTVFHADLQAPPYLHSHLVMLGRQHAAETLRNKRAMRQQLLATSQDGALGAEQQAQLRESQPKGRLAQPLRCRVCITKDEQPPLQRIKRGWFWSLEAARDHWRSKHSDQPMPDDFLHHRSRFTVSVSASAA
jgi:hypothetical protein